MGWCVDFIRFFGGDLCTVWLRNWQELSKNWTALNGCWCLFCWCCSFVISPCHSCFWWCCLGVAFGVHFGTLKLWMPLFIRLLAGAWVHFGVAFFVAFWGSLFKQCPTWILFCLIVVWLLFDWQCQRCELLAVAMSIFDNMLMLGMGDWLLTFANNFDGVD